MLNALLFRAWTDLCIPMGEISPFRLFQFATVGLDGRPKIRTLVLRSADKSASVLTFFIDKRSQKYKEILSINFVSLISFDAVRNVQLRLEGVADFEDAQYVEEYWDNLRTESKKAFSGYYSPGTVVDNPNEAWNYSSVHIDNFCVLKVVVTQMDWLELTESGNIRAKFRRNNERWNWEWVAP